MTMLTPEEIKGLRKALGLTLAQLGAKVGVSESAVGHWETGFSHPRYKAMVKLNELAAEAKASKKRPAAASA